MRLLKSGILKSQAGIAGDIRISAWLFLLVVVVMVGYWHLYLNANSAAL